MPRVLRILSLKRMCSQLFNFTLLKGILQRGLTWTYDEIPNNALNSILNWEFQNALLH